MTQIVLPHRFTPRRYQLPVLRALDRGATRAVAVWHRRAGKEKTFVNYTAKKTAERVGTYFYLFPTYKQGKKAIWDGMDRDGFKFIKHFPDPYVVSRNETELKLTLANGSIFQIVGTDNIDAVMSTNPIGCVFAEYSLHDPKAWDYLRPILKENGGWAVFDFTPRGKNHGWKMYEMARQFQAEGDPNWFCERLTVDDTQALSRADIDTERREGMSEDMIQQEYYCSFEGVQQGSVYGAAMDLAEREGRVCSVPWQPEAAVDTFWDIGTSDTTAIWFKQTVGREVHVIDYIEESGKGCEHFCGELRKKPYVYGRHVGPHDIMNRSFVANGKSSLEVAKTFGINFEVCPKISVADGIKAARAYAQRCWFDRSKTERGRDSLTSYHYTWDDKRKMFSTDPYHDWSSNGSDAFRYMAVADHNGMRLRNAREDRETIVVSSRSYAGPGAGWLGA